ncbi:MAG: TonB family protein [Bacteroidetes bacterium]|nr:TonB family protein [Bacteroidota bacterium]
MKTYLLVTFLLLAGVCTAQKRRNIYFLKYNGNYVGVRDSADYMRIVEEPDSGSTLYNVFEYYLDGKAKSVGQSSRIDPPRYEGQCIMYYRNGKKRSITIYKDGSIAQDQFWFYTNGKPYLVLRYPPGTIEETDFTDKQIIACFDSTGTALATEGNGSFKIYDNKFKRVIEWGTVKEGKHDGKCEGIDEDGKGRFTEEYKDGALISGTLTDSAGNVSIYNKARTIDPDYNGGLKAFYEYLSKNIRYPEHDKARNVTGTVVLYFVVEKSGKVTNIKVMKHVSDAIDAEAVRVVRASPLWIPGKKYGLPVRVHYTIPVSFALQEE